MSEFDTQLVRAQIYLFIANLQQIIRASQLCFWALSSLSY